MAKGDNMRKQDIINRIQSLKADYAALAAAHYNAYRNCNVYDDESEVDWALHLAYRDIYKDLFKLYEDAVNKG